MSEFDGIMKLLKQTKEVEKKEESSNSYEQFKQNKKVPYIVLQIAIISNASIVNCYMYLL